MRGLVKRARFPILIIQPGLAAMGARCFIYTTQCTWWILPTVVNIPCTWILKHFIMVYWGPILILSFFIALILGFILIPTEWSPDLGRWNAANSSGILIICLDFIALRAVKMDYGIAGRAHMNHGNVDWIWTYLPGKWKYKTTSEFSLCIHHLILWVA